MKDEFGIEVKCENCAHKGLLLNLPGDCSYCPNLIFVPSTDAYEARIAELQNSLDEIEETLTKTIKLLSERSRECGELQALIEVKNKSNISTQSTGGKKK